MRLAAIDPSALKSLSLVNKALFEESERWRWRDVTLSTSRMKALERRIDVITCRKGRAGRVRSLRLQFRQPIQDFVYWTVATAKIKRLLSQTDRLEGLFIEDSFEQVGVACLRPSPTSPYKFHLATFELRTEASVNPSVYGFLAQHPTVHQLSLHSYRRAITNSPSDASKPTVKDSCLDPQALPHLATVYAPLGEFLPHVMSGRPIKYAAVKIDSSESMQPLWDALSTSSNIITSFSVILDTPRQVGDLLKRLPQHLPHLRFLSCDWSAVRGWPEFDNETMEALRSLSSLECIRWRGGSLSGFEKSKSTPGIWTPTAYAGPSLRIVQNEVAVLPIGNCDDTCQEGYWELVCARSNTWSLHSQKFFAPPLRAQHTINPLVSFASTLKTVCSEKAYTPLF